MDTTSESKCTNKETHFPKSVGLESDNTEYDRARKDTMNKRCESHLIPSQSPRSHNRRGGQVCESGEGNLGGLE